LYNSNLFQNISASFENYEIETEGRISTRNFK
jgi:hypothetical protein